MELVRDGRNNGSEIFLETCDVANVGESVGISASAETLEMPRNANQKESMALQRSSEFA